MQPFQGPYIFEKKNIEKLSPLIKGVYYIGVANGQGGMYPHYVGKGCGVGGIRARLLEHVERGWEDASCFGYMASSSIPHIDAHELAEIKRCNPKYNIVGT